MSVIVAVYTGFKGFSELVDCRPSDGFLLMFKVSFVFGYGNLVVE